jgi:DNA-binding MarR family transcriptional regulator
MPRAKRSLTDADYERLAELRYGLRVFTHWSAERARRAGITPTQHQLLLAVRASRTPRGATIGDVAEVLLIRHHSAVGLVDRAQDAGLITRERDPEQQSVVHLRLTDQGESVLTALSEDHLRELTQLAPTMQALFGALSDTEAAGLMLLRQ